MAVSIAQYVDLLFKKLQGVAKTANSTVKGASNESIASPAFLRGDVIWMEADQIPATAQSVANIANALTGSNSIECTADTTVPPIGGIRPTWLTNKTYWISQEFGSTWLPKVFVGPTGEANIEATGTQIFAAGIGGVGEYYFDTQAGVLNFIGETIPTVLTAGNVVYISGYQYSGLVGVTNAGAGNIGNLSIANTTITTDGSLDNITIEPVGNGVAIIDATTGLILPVGNTLQRPTSPTTGTLRFNTTTVQLEIWDGAEWDAASGTVATISNETFYGDGSTVDFTLSQESTSDGVIVTLNGLQQAPGTAYTVSTTTLTFTEAPQSGDVIQVRFIASTKTITGITNAGGNASVEVNDTAPTVEITGNLVPIANVTYSLGNSTNYWNNLYLSGNTIYLGPLQLKAINSTTFAVYQSDGSTQANIDVGSIDVTGITNGTTNISIPTTNGNANISVGGTSNVLVITSTGANVTGYLTATGNITGGNLTTAGQVVATGNVTGGNIKTSSVTIDGTSLSGATTVSATNLTGTLTTAAQPNITSVGTLSSLTVTANITGGNLITGGLASITGNVTGGNLVTAGQVIATGNVTGGNIKTSSIVISGTTLTGATTVSATNLTGTLTTAAQPNVTSVGTLSSLSVTANITGGNLITSGLVSTSSITKTGSNAVGNIGSASNYFDTVFATSTSALYADLAEMYLADQTYEPGTVLSFGGSAEVTLSSVDQDTAVAGIVSTQPAYQMNSGLTGEHVVSLALIGRVPCRVKGPVFPGSLLVSTNDGYARAEINPKPGTIIAKAIESFSGEIGIIEVVVGRT